MRSESNLPVSKFENLQSNSLTISLLNIRSLSNHLVDKRILEGDIICMTETQQLSLSNSQHILQLPALTKILIIEKINFKVLQFVQNMILTLDHILSFVVYPI